MGKVELKSFYTTNVNLKNPGDFGSDPITVNTSHKVVLEGNNKCRCESGVEMFFESEKDDAEKTFYVLIEISASIDILDENMSRDELHNAAVKETFPFLRAAVTSIMSACGFPHIILPADLIK